MPPRRGLIFDRNGVLLADNIPAFSLMMTPHKMDEMQKRSPNYLKLSKSPQTTLKILINKPNNAAASNKYHSN